MRKVKREVALIAAVFLLLCVISLYRQAGMRFFPEDPVRPVVVYFVYVLLLAGWWGAVRNRITQRSMRVFLMAETILMYIGTTIRFIHDAFIHYFTYGALSDGDILLARFSGYFHAVPFVLIPIFGLFASFGLGRTEEYRFKSNRYLLLIPAVALILLLLTNDSHNLIFLPLQDELQEFLYYYPNVGLYVIITWAFLLLLFRVYVVYNRSRVLDGSTYLRLVPLLFTVLLILVNIPYILSSFVVDYELMEHSVLLFFLEIMVWESSVLVGMVPVNTHYDEVFDRSTVAMLIVNEDGQAYLKSSGAPDLPMEMFEALKQKSIIRTPEGKELNLHSIRGGYAVWLNDVSETITVIDELQKTAEKLDYDGLILRQELAVRSDEAAVREQNRIYNQLTNEVGEQLILLRNLLGRRERVADKAMLFKTICLIGAYIKRRCNLRLVEQSDGIISNQELDLCYSELTHCLEQMGVEALVIWHTGEMLAPEFAIFTLDVFEFLLEYERFDLHSIRVSFETDTAFSIQLCFDGGSTRQIPVGELQRINKEKYNVSWLSLDKGYQVSIHS